MRHAIERDQIRSEIRKLDVIQRLNLLTDVWDEIKESKELESVSDEEKRILLDRLANYKANPGSAVDWMQLKEEAYSRYDRKS
jgi:putative addiction module component (TIGR02574 family)